MFEESPVWGFFVLVGFDIINTNAWSSRKGSMIYFSPRVLRISRLTGKTGFNKQDMGPIPVVLNI